MLITYSTYCLVCFTVPTSLLHYLHQLSVDYLEPDYPSLLPYPRLTCVLPCCCAAVLTKLSARWTTNYVSDWWEEYVYLRGRSGIMVNSNFYGIDAILEQPSSVQAARAANITHATMLFRRAIDRQEIEPVRSGSEIEIWRAE